MQGRNLRTADPRQIDRCGAEAELVLPAASSQPASDICSLVKAVFPSAVLFRGGRGKGEGGSSSALLAVQAILTAKTDGSRVINGFVMLKLPGSDYIDVQLSHATSKNSEACSNISQTGFNRCRNIERGVEIIKVDFFIYFLLLR